MPTIITLPDIDWTECDLTPVAPRATDRMEGRRTEMQTSGQWYWTLKLTGRARKVAGFGQMDVFSMMAGDNGEVFVAYNVFRPRPIKFGGCAPLGGTRAGGGAFDGTATLTARTAFSATVSGLPAGFPLSAGDYVEFRMSPTKRSLHMITADATANGSGVVTIAFKYALDLQHFTTAAVVNFEKPSCIMQIDPGSYSGGGPKRLPTLSFTATEVFLP